MSEFWKGRFGDQYIERNKSEDLLASYTAMWAKILAKTEGVNSALEIGANVGLNLDAISRLRPGVHCEAIETNELACRQLQRKGYVAHNIAAQETWDAIGVSDVLSAMAPAAAPGCAPLISSISQSFNASVSKASSRVARSRPHRPGTTRRAGMTMKFVNAATNSES